LTEKYIIYISNMEGQVMDLWQDTDFESLIKAESEDLAFASIARLARKLGFEYCAYGIRVLAPLTKPKIHLVNNYSDEWRRRYSDNNYLAIDPTVVHGMRSVMPLIWSDQVFAACPEFWEDAREHGLRVGWAQSCYNPRGSVGMISFARSDDDLSPLELKHCAAQMCLLAHAAHEALGVAVLSRLVPESAADLSGRELEVLRWTADGKTSSEIGEIMNIAERTVNFHVNNAVAKLKAGNKTSAAIKAAMFGFL
jgi:LuxR family quorum-sensing system transcriptional regulator SolR